MAIRTDAAEEIYHHWNLFGSKWLGLRSVKNPCDAWIYQELIYQNKPDIIIETGTYMGGGALFLASMCDLVGNGKILTIETEAQLRGHWAGHNRIEYHNGSSTSPLIFEQIKSKIPEGAKVMVILDSDHHKNHVAKELELYAPLVTQGQYLIVEDTWWNPEPSEPEMAGPYPAVIDFMKGNEEFIIDKECERFLISNNPSGFLKKL